MNFEEELHREQLFNELYMRELDGENGKIYRSSDGWGIHEVQFTPGPVMARLAFEHADDSIGMGFYVGPRYASVVGTTVVNWDSGVGGLLNLRELGGRYNDTPRVVARRVFLLDDSKIIDFFDEPKGTTLFQGWGPNEPI